MDRPTLDEPMIEAALAAARAEGKLAVCHVSSAAGAELALKHGAHGLVHLFADTPVDPGWLERAVAARLFVVPTMAIISNVCGENTTARISGDPELNPFLTEAELANLVKTFPVREKFPSSHAMLVANIRTLEQAGIPVLAGTDAPNQGTVHGASLHHELQQLVDAGLEPGAALAAATSRAADAFGLADRGRIREGLRADLILVDGNPADEIAHTARIRGVWKAGHAVDREWLRAKVTDERAKSGQQH
jgi:imidazolonepropionase-like amidohydrolase